MDSKKIAIGFGVALVVIILSYIVYSDYKKKLDSLNEKKDKISGDDTSTATPPPPPPPPIPTPTGTGVGTGTPPPPPPPTGTTKGGTGGTKNNTGTGANKIVKDPETPEGKNIIHTRMSEFATNVNAMMEIKKNNGIGSGLWNGISNQNWNPWYDQNNEAPLASIKRFFHDEMKNPDIFDWYRMETWPIYHDIEKPTLRAEMKKITQINWFPTFGTVSLTQFKFGSLSGADLFSFFGGIERRHEQRPVEAAKTFCNNYIREMDKLDDALYLSAINSLKQQDNIYFTGINA